MSGSARVAAALWIAWAVIVWNVVFDHVIATTARRYVAAAAAAAAHDRFLRMDDWMVPALSRGLWMASAAAVLIVAVGTAGLVAASRRRPA